MFRRISHTEDEGFTLIELLVVMIIIGILAAVAIPTFLSQKAKAADTAVKSDLRNMVSQMEQDGGYLNAQQLHDAGVDFKTSKDTTVLVVWANSTGYCLAGTNKKSSKATVPLMGIPTKIFYFGSGAGSITSVDTSGPGCLTASGAAMNNGYFDATGFHSGAPNL